MSSVQNPANENTAPDENVPVEEASSPASNEELLQAEVARLTEEVAKLRDQWVRSVAEADNIRKRSQRELEENSKYAVTGFAGEMVNVLENLKRATDSVPMEQRKNNEFLKVIGEGIDLTMQELLNIFKNYNITRINPIDQKFDHNLHQAVAQVERHDIAAGTVVQVVQAGYTIHDRLLRPAMVVVSKAGEAPKPVDTIA